MSDILAVCKVDRNDKRAVLNLAGQFATSIVRDLQSAFWDVNAGKPINGTWLGQANSSLKSLTSILAALSEKDLTFTKGGDTNQ